MIVVTGGAGFIGSAFIAKLNSEGISDILVVDELGSGERWKNLLGKKFFDYLHKDVFIAQAKAGSLPQPLSAIVHMGACSSTTETNVEYLMDNNYRYSVTLAEFANSRGIRFLYASSAATYGNGSQGYSDEGDLVSLQPLNPYGYSKYLFDIYMQRQGFPNSLGLKFFNVFGPNEYHKGDMRSMVVKAHHQIQTSGKVRLFKSAHPDFKDGEQKRDFIYVKDCCEIMWWLLKHPKVCGVYNLGSGRARSWNDLVGSVFQSLGLTVSIEYIDMPNNIRGQYQYFTEAPMQKLKAAGCPVSPRSLEEAIGDFVGCHLENTWPYL